MKRPAWRRYLRFWGRDIDADIDDEVRFHLEMRAGEYAAGGLSDSDARRASRERFGDVDGVRASLRRHDVRRARDLRRRRMIDELRQDLRLAARGLCRSPALTALISATLGLAIGATTSIFSVVDAVLLRPLPFDRPEELVRIWGSTGGELTRIRALATSYVTIGAHRLASVSVSGEGEPERLDAARATPSLMPMLGVAPALGRGFVDGEDEPGRDRVVVLSDGVWRRRFAGDSTVLGRALDIDGVPHVIVGVMPPRFVFPVSSTELWTPLTIDRSNLGMLWGSGGNRITARLRPGVTAARAQEELRRIARQIRLENPVWDPGPEYGSDAAVTSLHAELIGNVRQRLMLLVAMAACLLLVACANVANLLLVRGAARRRELAIRLAVGAGRARLVRLLMTEGALLALAGGALGGFLAWQGVTFLTALIPAGIPGADRIAIDTRVLTVAALLSLGTSVLFALFPALRAVGAATPDALSAGGRGGSHGPRHHRLTGAIVTIQVALSVVLVTSGALLVRSFRALTAIDPGFRAEQVIAARLSPPQDAYADPGRRRTLYATVLERVAALPGVTSAGAVNQLSLRQPPDPQAVRIQGQFEDFRRTLPMADHRQIVTPGYLATMGIPVLRGRGITDGDGPGAPPVALVSASFARRFWPAEDAVGKRIGYPQAGEWITIVGVVGDVKQKSLGGGPDVTVYHPFDQAPTVAMTLVVRTSQDERTLAAALRTVAHDVDRSIPISDVTTVRAVVAASVAPARVTMRALAAFALITLLLAAIGIYGVMANTVSQRTREIGVRMALGATPGAGVRLVLRRASRLVGAGVVIGIVGAVVAARAMSGLLFGIPPTDPLSIGAALAILLVAALLASAIPAVRATRVDPTIALRAE